MDPKKKSKIVALVLAIVALLAGVIGGDQIKRAIGVVSEVADVAEQAGEQLDADAKSSSSESGSSSGSESSG